MLPGVASCFSMVVWKIVGLFSPKVGRATSTEVKIVTPSVEIKDADIPLGERVVGVKNLSHFK